MIELVQVALRCFLSLDVVKRLQQILQWHGQPWFLLRTKIRYSDFYRTGEMNQHLLMPEHNDL